MNYKRRKLNRHGSCYHRLKKAGSGGVFRFRLQLVRADAADQPERRFVGFHFPVDDDDFRYERGIDGPDDGSNWYWDAVGSEE